MVESCSLEVTATETLLQAVRDQGQNTGAIDRRFGCTRQTPLLRSHTHTTLRVSGCMDTTSRIQALYTLL